MPNIIAMPMKNYLVLGAGVLWTSGAYAVPIIPLPVMPWSLSCPISSHYLVDHAGAYNSGSCTVTKYGTLEVNGAGDVTNSGRLVNLGNVNNLSEFVNTATGTGGSPASCHASPKRLRSASWATL